MKLKTLVCSIAAFAFATGSSQAAVTIGVNNLGTAGRSFNTSSGALLGAGAASMHVGYFLNWQTANLTSGNLSNILTNFIPLGEGRAGLGTLVAPSTGLTNASGKATLSINGITGTTAPGAPAEDRLVQGTRLFVLVYNTAQTEFALFSDTVSTAWVAPNDDPNLGGSATLAINTDNFQPASASTELFHGTYPAAGNFINLAPVIPEPGTASMGLLAALGLLVRRRR